MKVFQKLPVIFLACLSFLFAKGQGVAVECDCDHIIENGDLIIDGQDIEAQPGDVVCIMAGEKKYLNLLNFHGTENEPITFINCGGRVTISNNDWEYGIRLDNCRYFKFTGTGDPEHEYGFHISEASGEHVVGLNIGNLSTDMEIDHVEIENTGFAGIMTKTDPDCEGKANRGNFVQRNTIVRDNYIHDTKGEGIYVGFPHYTGAVRFCNGDSVRLYPHDLHNVMIYNNNIERTGREGVQVGCAVSGCTVFGNKILGYGLRNQHWQNAGIHISTGTTGDVRNNFVKEGLGPGMLVNARGDNLFFNNIIADPGTDGFSCHDSLVQEGTGYHIINNTIVNCGRDGIHFDNKHTSSNNEFINNLIGGVRGDFFKIANEGEFYERNNITAPDQRLVFFHNINANDYKLQPFSPGIDAGMDVSDRGITYDYDYVPRPKGEAYDVGAYESEYEKNAIDFDIYPVPASENLQASFINYEDGYVRINIYDELGRLMAVLQDGFMEAGVHEIRSSVTQNLASAVYFLELRREDVVKVKRIVVIH